VYNIEGMRRIKNKKIIYTLSLAILLIAVAFLALPAKKPQSRSVNNSASSSPSPAGSSTPVNASTSYNKNQYPQDQASSPWVVVNKGRVLPSNYVPGNLITPNVRLRLSSSSPEMHLRSDAAAAMEKMFAAAKNDQVNLMLESGYRSYNAQVGVYGGYVASSGVAKADTFSARPGHSEHQTGLAADIEPLSRTCEVEQCFENTPEGQWLAANAYKFGFVIRYQKNTQNLTGYEYEPWHVRYLGTDLSNEIHNSGQTLEQFFNLPIYTTYPTTFYEIKNI
jgi:D-alanyl-D-alanine carboxypeptidase